MNNNKLKLNDDKTEILLMKSSRQTINTPSVSINHSIIDMAEKAKNLGVMFDSDFSMQYQLSSLCKSLHFQLRKIGIIRDYLTEKVAKTLVTSLILSKLDYCNSILAGCPQNKLQKLQSIMNNSARLVCRKPKTTHVTQLHVLRSLHWLPVKQRIDYKIAVMCFKCIHKQAPSYLTDLLEILQSRKCLRSSKDTRVNPKRYGEQSFSYIGPMTWNKIPMSVRQSPTLEIFKKRLKTLLFQNF
ncbi:reverse transcriptase-like protein [Elysia marginata]|uniref:Reverse transcriptase-like protein n=1 Tax=Elysia marginata TaxID=1093978 RepID=A0AAV4HP27_9GAST|nr:reverse transcriptase-like protein [Elysia marginata]